ncbi:hypothetical protein EG68_07041 [Paragonimus skrjabini miyazakii]|uniref:Uncharacterized protein n=1 Tax=Paragonimus skrjabini miyazakii TaxID=59628 RepID=A0A8S9YWQ0_9TREM|nr:hypothetical protein EG68_07041 [Paragonimus skrjabini miyazakii]
MRSIGRLHFGSRSYRVYSDDKYDRPFRDYVCLVKSGLYTLRFSDGVHATQIIIDNFEAFLIPLTLLRGSV